MRPFVPVGSMMLSLGLLLVVASRVTSEDPPPSPPPSTTAPHHWHPYPENPHLIPPGPVTKPAGVQFTLTWTWHDWDTAHDENHNEVQVDNNWDNLGEWSIDGNGCPITGFPKVNKDTPFPGSFEIKVPHTIPAGAPSGTRFTPVGTFDDEPLPGYRGDPPQSATVEVTTQ
jgi:hypothetical protein